MSNQEDMFPHDKNELKDLLAKKTKALEDLKAERKDCVAGYRDAIKEVQQDIERIVAAIYAGAK